MKTLRPFGSAGTGNISNETTEFGIFSTNGDRPSASGYVIVRTFTAGADVFLAGVLFDTFAFGGTVFAFADF